MTHHYQPSDRLAEHAAGLQAEAADYYPLFDWLRAALAITVMLKHDRVIEWVKAASFAVEVFFVLSGWLIGGLLLKTRREDLPRFYFNRAVRIWAPYYLGFGLLVAASLLKDPITGKWREFVAYKALMVWNLFGSQQLAEFRQAMPLQATGNHFWSVNAEEQFYLLSPLLLVLAPRWGRSPLLWAVLALGAWLAGTYAAIVLGVLAAVLVHRYGDMHATIPARLAMLTLAASCAAGLYLGGRFEHYAPLCGLGIVMLLAVRGQASRLGAIAGGMSYPLYLNHWIGVFVCNALMAPYGLRNSSERQLAACLLNVAIAVALYWWFDRKLLARRGEWFTPKRGRALMWVAYGMVGCGIVFGLAMGVMRP